MARPTRPARLTSRGSRLRPDVLWALLDQGAWAFSNFALTVAAGRELGPSGLGPVAVGFSSSLIALGFFRSLLIDPLITASSALPRDQRAEATRASLTFAGVAAAVTSTVFAALGLAIPGFVGLGLRLFAPFVGLILVVELGRALLFRDDQGPFAARLGLLRVATLIGTFPFLQHATSPWWFVTWWGVSATVVCVPTYRRIALAPTELRQAWADWRGQHWAYAKWLAAESSIFTVGDQITMLVLAIRLGPDGTGGLRAIQAIFTPLTVIVPGVSLFALPRLARSLLGPWSATVRMAGHISMIVLALTLTYVIPVVLFRDQVIDAAFGPEFIQFAEAGWAFAVGASLAAATVGFGVLLRARRRGRQVLYAGTAGTLCALALAVPLAGPFGVTGAAWGLSLSVALMGGVAALFGLSRPASAREQVSS